MFCVSSPSSPDKEIFDSKTQSLTSSQDGSGLFFTQEFSMKNKAKIETLKRTRITTIEIFIYCTYLR